MMIIGIGNSGFHVDVSSINGKNWGMSGISPMSLGFAEEDLFFPTGHLSTWGNYRDNV
jgi:hypothetical protein